MNHVISFSGGALSALMTERVLKRGADGVFIVFMDTLIEDDDVYRFIDDCVARWQRLYGVELTRLTVGETPLQVARRVKLLPNQMKAPCTRVLKLEPFRRFLKTLAGPSTIYVGYDFSEVHRCESTTRNYNQAGYEVDYPMLWAPIEHRPYKMVLAKAGLTIPRTYAMGYSHANCGGCCVKQGAADWRRTLLNFPDRYAEFERWEKEQRAIVGDHSFLRDRTGGKTKTLTLEALRLDIESQPAMFDFANFDAENTACVVCGPGEMFGDDAIEVLS